MTQKSWSIDKKIPLSIILTLTGYSVAGIIYLADMRSDIAQLKLWQQATPDLPEKQVRLEEKYVGLKEQLVEIKASQERMKSLILKLIEGRK